MVKILIGNIFESKAQTLVNTVNCVGVMGKGIALEFRKRFPDMYNDYAARCAAGQVKLGQPYLFRRLLLPWILNFPTKDHWRSVSRLSDIVTGLGYLEKHYQEWGIMSLAVPPLGCGQGQLEWQVVGPTLYRYLSRLNIPVELYAPIGTPGEELEATFLEHKEKVLQNAQSGMGSKILPAWVALVMILDRIESEPYHWPVGRTVFQKIAYFATELGLPTGLCYTRGSYGPFTSELKALITRLVNHGMIKEEKLGRMLSVKPGPTYRDAVKAFQRDVQRWERIIEQVADLFLRMRTQEAEIAATVHFAAKSLQSSESIPSEADVLEEVRRWKQKRRPPLNEEDIGLAIRSLNIMGWLDVRPSVDLPIPKEITYEL